MIFKTKKDLLNTKNLQNYVILSESIIENLDNQILVNNLPMKINTLIEKINMSFLKKNYNTQSEILIKNYKIDLNSRIMWKGR